MIDERVLRFKNPDIAGQVRVLYKGKVKPPSPAYGWGISAENADRLTVMGCIASMLPFSVQTIVSPNPKRFTREIMTSGSAGWTKEDVPTKCSIGRKKVDGVTRYLTGPFADGALITEPGEAYYIATADCPVGILLLELPGNKGAFIAFHAGRACLLPSGRFTGEIPAQTEEETIVYSVVSHARRLGVIGGTIHFVRGISPMHFRHLFNHPEYGERNRKMAEYLEAYYDPFPGVLQSDGFALNLIALASQQFQKAGLAIRGTNTDQSGKIEPILRGNDIGNCTYSDSYRLYSYGRSVALGEPTTGRNGVLVALERKT